MTILNFAIKSAFIAGALTAGAFLTGASIGLFVNKDKAIDKIKKMQIKKLIILSFFTYKCETQRPKFIFTK